jgi:MFS family permease
MRGSLTSFQVITAEFAPRKYRARMLSWVFFAQPIGQLLANVLSLAAVEAYKPWIEQNLPYCPPDHVECFRAIDRLWRLVVGIGIIPAVIAFLNHRAIRLTYCRTLKRLSRTRRTTLTHQSFIRSMVRSKCVPRHRRFTFRAAHLLVLKSDPTRSSTMIANPKEGPVMRIFVSRHRHLNCRQVIPATCRLWHLGKTQRTSSSLRATGNIS